MSVINLSAYLKGHTSPIETLSINLKLISSSSDHYHNCFNQNDGLANKGQLKGFFIHNKIENIKQLYPKKHRQTYRNFINKKIVLLVFKIYGTYFELKSCHHLKLVLDVLFAERV